MKHRLLPRLLLLSVITPSLLPAECRCPVATPETQVENASYVFQGRLSELRTNKKTKERKLYFEILDTYKGDLKEDTGIQDLSQGSDCAIPFKEGEVYMVYARWELGFTVIKPCSGTKLIKQTEYDEASAAGPGSEYKAQVYKKVQALCMGHRETFCCLDSLKAMKAAHALPEPDEGCPDGMKPDRLSCIGSLVWCVPIVANR